MCERRGKKVIDISRAGLIRTMNLAIPYCEHVKRFYRQAISLKAKFYPHYAEYRSSEVRRL